MTLDTHIHLRGPITLEQAFDLGVTAVLTAAGVTDRRDFVQVEASNYHWDRACGIVGMQTVVGQGLPAWMYGRARADGQEITPEPPDEDGDRQNRSVELSWDTGYAYEGANGESASQMHGAALMILHRSLPEGVTMRWQDEFRMEWFDGLDGLGEFMNEGENARNWLGDAIATMTAAAGKR